MTEDSPEAHRPSVTEPRQASVEEHSSAEALATEFGLPVYLPSRWPEGSHPPAFFLERFSNPPRVSYRIEVIQKTGVPINIIGWTGKASQRAGVNGWQPAPGMEALGGLMKPRGDSVDLILWKDTQVIYLTGYQSAYEALDGARSLRQVA